FYTVLIDRAKSPDATLASFGSELVTMTSPIVDGTLNYSGTVTHTTSNDRFNPASSSGRASLKVWVNDQPVDSYGGYYMLFGFGTNKLTVEVTSEDGNNTKTYNLNVVREKSNNARLANLYIPFLEGGLDQSFDGDVYAYTANMADSIYTGLPLRLHAENDFATVKVNGLAVPRFQDYQMVLHGGPNTFNIVVTSQDGSQTKTYQLVFTRGGTPPPAKSPVARLASLNVSAAPSFSKNFNLSYEELTTINAPNSVASVRFFLNKEHPNSTITLNGAAYDAEINESDLHPIVVGDNLFTVVVTAEDGVVTKTYEVHVNRLPYVNVDLASLSINRGPLTPVFSAATTTYNVSVPNNVETVTVTPTVANAGNTVQVNGTTIDAANPTATVNVFTGPPTRIRTVVRSADGVTSKTYTIVVTRLPSDDATLSSLGASSAVSPVFSAAVTNYTATVGSAVTTYTIAPLVNHPGANAVVTVNGAPYNSEETPEIALEMGLTTIVTTVTANNGVATKTYTLKVYRGSNVATASLAIDTRTPLTVTTGTGYRNFVTSVDFNATSISVKPTLTDLNAIVT
ncbi:MAG: cadherin-like beta sandwich domain-containing protein, partial [Pedobacter sp.]